MGAVENLKDVADLVKKTGEIDLYRKILAAEDEVQDLTRDKRRFQDRIEELERALKFKEETVFRAPFYYLKNGDQTPYCAHCLEKNQQAVHVVLKYDNEDRIRWDCFACQQMYAIEKRGHQQGQRQESGHYGVWS